MENMNLGELGGIFQDLQGQVDQVLDEYNFLQEQYKELEESYNDLKKENADLMSMLEEKDQLINGIKGAASGLMGRLNSFRQEEAAAAPAQDNTDNQNTQGY